MTEYQRNMEIHKAIYMKITSLITGAILIAILSSCSVTSKVSNDVTYTSNSFSVKALNDGGLSLLPVVAGSGVEGYRRPFGDRMNAVGDSLLNNFKDWNETLQTLNDADLVPEYNSAIQSYQQTGIVDKSLLVKMAEATGVNYFLYVQLGSPTSEKDYNFDMWSGYLSESETNAISAFALIWGAEEGDIVWEGYASAEVTTDEFTYTKESDFDRAQKVAESLMESVYTTRNYSYPAGLNRPNRQ